MSRCNSTMTLSLSVPLTSHWRRQRVLLDVQSRLPRRKSIKQRLRLMAGLAKPKMTWRVCRETRRLEDAAKAIKEAERVGFKVQPQLKERSRIGRRRAPCSCSCRCQFQTPNKLQRRRRSREDDGGLGVRDHRSAAPPAASAQDHRVRISVNGGVQEGSGRLAVSLPLTSSSGSGSFTIDDRLVTSAVVDVNGSVRVWKNVALGAGLSRIRTEKLAHPYTATVPQPSGQNVVFSGVAANTVHGERTVYALASWTATISNRFDVVLSAGPAFFDVEQDVPTATTVTAPNGLRVLTVSSTKLSESATGFHAGLDLDYVFARRAGLGILMRYTRGAIDIPNGTQSMTVGGVQIAGGLRLQL